MRIVNNLSIYFIFCWHQASSSTSWLQYSYECPNESPIFDLNLENPPALEKRAITRGSGIEYYGSVQHVFFKNPPRWFSYHWTILKHPDETRVKSFAYHLSRFTKEITQKGIGRRLWGFLGVSWLDDWSCARSRGWAVASFKSWRNRYPDVHFQGESYVSVLNKLLTTYLNIMNFLELQWCSVYLYSGKQLFIFFWDVGLLQWHLYLVTKPWSPQSAS